MRSFRRFVVLIVVCLGLPATFLTGCTPAPIADQGYQLVFEDNFDTLDTSVWAEPACCGGSVDPTISPEGYLTLTALPTPTGTQWGHLASTGPRSSGEPSYPNPRAWQEGYFEARIRYTNNPWSWPAFWLFSMAKSEAWPGEDCSRLTSEWDIMENGVQNGQGQRPADRWFFTNLHRNTRNGQVDYCGTPDEHRSYARDYTGVADLSDWHTWSGRWTEDELCTYMDDVQINCSAPFDTTAQPMHLVFTMQYLRQCDGCPARPSSLQMQVDWVRVWQQP